MEAAPQHDAARVHGLYPVVFLDHRRVHYVTGHIPEVPASASLEGPRRVCEGDACTVVATSYTVLECTQATPALAGGGVHVDPFDPRTLRPLDVREIAASVQRTERLVVVDTGYLTLRHRRRGHRNRCRSRGHRVQVFAAPPGPPGPSSAQFEDLGRDVLPGSPHIAAAIGEVVGVEKNRIADVVRSLSAVREKLPLDIPHPSFQGPF